MTSGVYCIVHMYYFVTCSRGAGAAPLPEREVSSQNIFFLSFCAASGGAKGKLTK